MKANEGEVLLMDDESGSLTPQSNQAVLLRGHNYGQRIRMGGYRIEENS